MTGLKYELRNLTVVPPDRVSPSIPPVRETCCIDDRLMVGVYLFWYDTARIVLSTKTKNHSPPFEHHGPQASGVY